MSDNPFQWVNEVTMCRDPIRGSENPDRAERDYNAFFTNRSLSYHTDAVMYVNEMNCAHSLDNQLQVDYLINSLRPRKRFAKWAKPVKTEDLEAVREYYGINQARAQEVLSILTPDQLVELKKRIERGGRDGGRTSRGGS